MNKIWGWILLCCLPAWVNAQFSPETGSYPFINRDTNQIQLNSSSRMETFFGKLDSLVLYGDSKINILHIGDSHIQADFFSHHLRDQLQSMALGVNGGRGFLFPYKIAKTNNPLNYRVSYSGHWKSCKNVDRDTNCSLGLSGMSVFTTDSGATFGLWFPERNQHEYLFDRVRVFHHADTSLWQIIPADSNLAYRKTHHPEYGYTRFIFPELRDSVGFKVIHRNSEAVKGKFNLFGLSFDNGEPGIVYHSVGVNGAEIRSFLKCDLLQQHLTALEPDLIVVSLGTNDAYMRKFNSQRFKYNYRQFLDRLKVAAPGAAFLLTAPGDNYRYRRYLNRNNSKAVKIIDKLAKNQHMTFWNFYQVMGKLNSISRWYRAGLTARDRLHFNRKGYYLQAKLLFSALMKAYGNHIEHKNKHQNQALTH